jgi:hypothetical protein
MVYFDKKTPHGYLFSAKKKVRMKSPKRKVTVLSQVCKLIPGHFVDKLAKGSGWAGGRLHASCRNESFMVLTAPRSAEHVFGLSPNARNVSDFFSKP